VTVRKRTFRPDESSRQMTCFSLAVKCAWSPRIAQTQSLRVYKYRVLTLAVIKCMHYTLMTPHWFTLQDPAGLFLFLAIESLTFKAHSLQYIPSSLMREYSQDPLLLLQIQLHAELFLLFAVISTCWRDCKENHKQPNYQSTNVTGRLMYNSYRQESIRLHAAT